MELRILVQLELNKTSKMQAKNASFVLRISWTVVSNTRIFPQGYANRYNLGETVSGSLYHKSMMGRIVDVPSEPDQPYVSEQAGCMQDEIELESSRDQEMLSCEIHGGRTQYLDS